MVQPRKGSSLRHSRVSLEEREWTRRACQHDPEAFSRLAALYRPRLYSLALGMLENPEDAQDATQEILVKAYARVDGFREGAAFFTWLYRIGVNHCIDFRRRRRQQAAASLEELLEDGRSYEPADPDAASDPARLAEEEERDARVRDAIQSLPPNLRLTVQMTELEGLSQREVASRLGCRVGAVKTRLHRARGILRVWLAPTAVRQALPQEGG